MLHGCTIGDNCLIAIGATIMDGAVIGRNSIVAGHAFVREGTIIPENSIVMGTPAKVVATRNNYVANRVNAMLYHRNAEAYARGEHRAWDGPAFEAAMTAWKARFEAELKRSGDQFFLAGAGGAIVAPPAGCLALIVVGWTGALAAAAPLPAAFCCSRSLLDLTPLRDMAL